MMTKDMKDLLSIFNANGVDYLVIGGYAYGVHLEPRTTKDLDLFIRSTDANAKAVFNALAQFGAPLTGLSPADFQDGTIFQLGIEPERVTVSKPRPRSSSRSKRPRPTCTGASPRRRLTSALVESGEGAT